MNKKKLFALILSTSITSNLLLSTTNVYAEEINTNNALSELSLEKNSYTEKDTSDLSSKEKNNLIVSTNETDTISTLATDVIVEIPDANLKLVLNEIIAQDSTNDITKSHLAQIREIEANYKNISNLEGLQYCTNLVILNLHDNHINYITPLANLTNLRILENLYANNKKISDLLPFQNLSVRNQIIELEKINLNSTSLEIENKIKNLNGEIVDNIHMNNYGIYNPKTNLVK